MMEDSPSPPCRTKACIVGGLNGITGHCPPATDYGHENLRPTLLVGLRVMNHPINNEGTFRTANYFRKGLSYTRHLYLNTTRISSK